MPVEAIWLHRGQPERPEAALHQLYGGPGTPTKGRATLSYADRTALGAGNLFIRVYSTRGHTNLRLSLR
jgi:hypothetical protein